MKLAWLLRIWRYLPSGLRFWYLRVRYGQFGVGLVALIQDDRGRILLVRRTYSRDEPWAMPGGWLERSDDQVQQALERELREETGLRVRAGAIRAVEHDGFAVVLVMDAVLLDPVANFRPSPEVSEVAWVERGQLAAYPNFNERLLNRAFAASVDAARE